MGSQFYLLLNNLKNDLLGTGMKELGLPTAILECWGLSPGFLLIPGADNVLSGGSR